MDLAPRNRRLAAPLSAQPRLPYGVLSDLPLTRQSDRLLAQTVEDFHRDGFVRVPGLLSEGELRALQHDTQRIIDGGYEDVANPTDYRTASDPDTGEDVFNRVQFVFPLATTEPNPLLALLGHPQVLALVHALLGDDALCNAEALVFKLPGNGSEVPVHADCNPADRRTSDAHLGFNVDFYLDDATLENGCLLAAPGSHLERHPREEIKAAGFDFPGLQPVPMRAGDVLFHDIRLVHGSHRSRGQRLRRTLYYEFQSLGWMQREGVRPGAETRIDDTWAKARIRLTQHAIETRNACPYAAGRDSVRLPGAGRIRCRAEFRGEPGVAQNQVDQVPELVARLTAAGGVRILRAASRRGGGRRRATTTR